MPTKREASITTGPVHENASLRVHWTLSSGGRASGLRVGPKDPIGVAAHTAHSRSNARPPEGVGDVRDIGITIRRKCKAIACLEMINRKCEF